MKFTRSNRIFAAFMAVLLLCASVPAQYSLGTRRMVSRPTPTLVNRGRLGTVLGPRPRMGFVGRIGGISSDGVAAPEQGLIVNSIMPTYSTSEADGQRLSVMINGQAVTAPIYDWQLIPIAKFADSDSFSCYTLFGRANDGPRNTQQNQNEDLGQDDSRYHEKFKDTLVGLRLFQLDSLIFDPANIDLVKDGNKYILGNGESAPNLEENRKGLESFRDYEDANPELLDFDSYIISDYRRNITFGVNEKSLSIKGEPYIYFWRIDPKAEYKFYSGEASKAAQSSLGSVSRYTRTKLITMVLEEAKNYDKLTDDTGFLNDILDRELRKIVVVDDSQRAGLLRTTPRTALFNMLVKLRAVNSLDWTIEMRELSDKVSNDTAIVRAINPAVWDTGVNLVRYAAFFRYCKEHHSEQWQAFMRQINAAPPPKPPVTTPSGFEY